MGNLPARFPYYPIESMEYMLTYHDIHNTHNNKSMEYMLLYHDIHHPNSTYLIEETTQIVMNEVRDDINILANQSYSNYQKL